MLVAACKTTHVASDIAGVYRAEIPGQNPEQGNRISPDSNVAHGTDIIEQGKIGGR